MVPATGSWTHRLNKLLIALGVIAFGVIVTDRVLEAFRADDAPVDVTRLDDASGVTVESVNEIAATTVQSISPAPVLDGNLPSTTQSHGDESDFAELDDMEVIDRLQELFGSRVVLVSATEPVYVMTEDMRRIGIGEAVNETITLAGVTADRLTLEHNGELMLLRLPDPAVE
ncbi:MAG: hypothetical protein HKN42_04510 [Granulosicoccus sp.]|nr:hypothetical protein [Granulosicoccus sp.]